MIDAFSMLDEFYQLEHATKKLTQKSEQYLFQLFDGKCLSVMEMLDKKKWWGTLTLVDVMVPFSWFRVNS